MENEFNNLRHFYLYAKYHYHRTGDMISDLKIIASDWCGINHADITTRDIIVILSNEVFKYIKTPHQFSDFINRINPNRWGDICTSFLISKSHDELVIEAFMGILLFTEVSDIQGKLGEADPKILPLSKEYKRRMRENVKTQI